MTQRNKNSYQHVNDKGENGDKRSLRFKSNQSRYATGPKTENQSKD